MASNSRVSVTIDVSANAAKAKSELGSLSDIMKNLNIGNKTQGQVKGIEDTISKLTSKFEEIAGEELDLRGLQQAEKDAKSLEKEFSKLVSIRDELSSKKGIELLPKNTQSGLSNIEKQFKTYEEYYEKTKIAMKSLQSYGQSNKGKENFDINSKGLGELRKQLKGIGIDLEYLPKGENNLDSLKQKINQLRDDHINKIRQAFSDLTGIPLDKVTNNIKTLQNQTNNFRSEKIEQAEQNYKDFDKIIQDLTPHIEEIVKQSQEKLFEGQDLNRRAQEIDRLAQSVEAFFGIQNMINLFKRGVREAIQVVQELDKAMAATAVVTDFTVNDMWKQLPTYQTMANELGVTIKDVYEASTLYYQQGLNTKQVMEVTKQTLQMARIAGIGAAEATDMMTAALRGFNMEVNEANAQKVNDIFSELAAITASDTKELGTALEKTASIAHSAGMSIEVTSALLAQAIEATREAPENIGTAMKTIIARFQELKKNPLTISEVDGETIDFNKVDTALKTIGIDLVQDTENFENLDNVLLEISSRWDGLTQTQRRYIATIVAGSRQQSRFIAMMGDNKRLTDLVSHAYDSAGAAARQYEKTQASLETAFNRVQNAWHVFLMGIANNQLIKAGAKALETIVNVADKLFGILGKLPGAFGTVTKSIAQLVATFAALKGAKVIIQGLLAGLSSSWQGKPGGFLGKKTKDGYVGGLLGKFGELSRSKKDGDNTSLIKRFFGKQKVIEKGPAPSRVGWGKINAKKLKIDEIYNAEEKNPTGILSYFKNIGKSIKGGALQSLQKMGGSITSLGGAFKVAGGAIKGFWGALGTGGQIALIIAGVVALISVMRKLIKTSKEKIEARDNLFQKYNESLEDIQKNITSVQDLENEFKSLANGVDENGKNIGLSAEEYAKYNDIVNQLVKISPEIVQGYTKEGQAIIDKNTAIEKSIDLLKEQKKQEQAEFFSPSNVKTSLEGYEGDLEKLAHDTEKLLGVIGVFQGSNLSENLDEYTEIYENALGQIEDIEQKKDRLQKIQVLQGTKSAVDKIYAQEANYLLDYANFLDIPQGLKEGQLPTYTSILKQMISDGDITKENVIPKLYEAFNITKDLEKDVDGYSKAVKKAEEAKKKFDKSAKTNEDIQEFNKAITESTTELDNLAEAQKGVGENGDKYAAAIKDQSEALRDYKKAVISVEKALNPLASAFNRATSNAKDLKEWLEGDTIHTASATMAENLDTVLDTKVDDDGNVTWGKHEVGRGSAQYWKVAEATVGKDYLESVNYDINKVNPRLHQMQTMLEGSQEGVQAFFADIEANREKLNKLGFAGNTAEEMLRSLGTQATDDKIKEFAKTLGYSDDALMAMTSKARQFADIGVFNPDMLRQAYGEQEEGAAVVGDITQKGKGFVLVSREQFEQDFANAGYTPDQLDSYRNLAAQAGVYDFEGIDDFTTVYTKALKQQNIDQQSLLQALETANATGQFTKDDLKELGQAWIKEKPAWLKTPEGGFAEGELDTLVDQITSTDDMVEPVDVIKTNTDRIATAVEALAQKEGVYTSENQKEIEGDLTVSNHQLNDLDISKYTDEELKTLRDNLIDSAKKNQETNENLNDIYQKGNKETKERVKATQELLADNDKLLYDKINTINKKLGIDETAEESIGSDKKKKNKKQTKTTTTDSEEIESRSSTLTQAIEDNPLAKPIVGEVDLDTEGAFKTLKALELAIGKYRQIRAEAEVAVNNKQGMSAIKSIASALQGLDGKQSITNVNVNDTGAAKGINNVISGIKKIPIGKEVNVYVQGIVNKGLSDIFGKLGIGGISSAVSQVALGKTYYDNGSTGGGWVSPTGGDNLTKGNVGSGGGSGGSGGSGGGGGSSDKKKEETYGDSLSKIYNELQKIAYYNQQEELYAARAEQLAKTRNTTNASLEVMANTLVQQREALKTTIQIQKSILSNSKATTQAMINQINKDLKEAGGTGNINDYLLIDLDKRLIQTTAKGRASKGDIKDVVSNAVSKLGDYFKELYEAEKGIEDNTAKIRDLYKQSNEDLAELEDNIEGGLVNFRQDAIDRLSQINTTISDSNKKILDATKESIELERQNRENDKKKQDLEDKRTRLSLLMQDTQGGHQVEIANLQKELAEGTQDFQDELVDQKLDELNKANEKAQEQRERQTTLLQRQLDWSQDTGMIWQEVYHLLEDAYSTGKWNKKSTASAYFSYNQGRQKNSLPQQKVNDFNRDYTAIKSEAGWVENYGTLLQRGQATSSGNGLNNGNKVTLIVDGQKTTGTYRKVGSDAWIDYVDSATGLTLKLKDKDIKQKTDRPNNYTVVTPLATLRKTAQAEKDAAEKAKRNKALAGKTATLISPDGQYRFNGIWDDKGGVDTRGINIGWTGKYYHVNDADLKYTPNGYQILKYSKTINAVPSDALLAQKWRQKMVKGVWTAFKTGGLADFTGPAWLDGTPSKPEMVLNQTDTQNFIQLKDILASIMKYNGLKSDNINTSSNGDTHYEVNINVDHLNSDYDVDKVAARVTKLITKSAAYRNPVKVSNYR